jgi:protein tyrosine phosphatase (PTP) superfamily phosphohydrolase (DUF442 family)
MSQLLDAAAGVPNAREPIPGIVTGGQPGLEHLAAMKQAGCDVLLDIREPMEPRPYRTPDAVLAAGLEYINIPVSHGPLSDDTFDQVRATMRQLAGRKRALFHCGSGNRVGVTLIPYFMLDLGMSEDEAVTEAMRVGTRNAGLIEEALDYVKRKEAKGLRG